jgi:hypothetical protein
LIDALRDRHDDRRRLIELIVVEREPENRRYRQPTSENRQRVAVHLDAKRPPNSHRGLRVLKLAVRFAEFLFARAVSAGYTAGFVDWRLNKLAPKCVAVAVLSCGSPSFPCGPASQANGPDR